jgi:hypothetical protein
VPSATDCCLGGAVLADGNLPRIVTQCALGTQVEPLAEANNPNRCWPTAALPGGRQRFLASDLADCFRHVRRPPYAQVFNTAMISATLKTPLPFGSSVQRGL